MGIGLLERRKPDVPRFLDPELLSRVPVQPVPSYDQMPSLSSGLLTRDPVNVPPPTIDMGQPAPVDASGMGAAPILITRNDRGRPLSAIGGGDPLSADQDLLRAQQDYKAPFSKKDFALRTLFGFLNHGVAGAGLSALDYGLDQNTRNQMAVGSDMARTQHRINDELLTRSQNNDLLNDQSTRNYRDAQSQELLSRASRPPKADSKFIERGDGVYEISTEFPEGRKVGNIPAEARTKNANPTRYFERPDGVYGINDAHPDGFKVSGVPGMPDKTAETLTRENEKAGQENSAIEQAIQAKRDEKAAMGQSPPTTITKVDPATITTATPNGIPQEVENPAYREWQSRLHSLEDDIQRLTTQKKPVVSTPRGARGTGGFKPARDGKFHYTPAQIRSSLAPGQTYEEVYGKLKANPKVIIEE